jgi:precorrin-6B methylase 2
VARPADFDLSAQLAKPSFTPGRADAPALVQLIVVGKDPAATRATAALASLREVARGAILGRFAEVDEGARARLIGVLGLLARQGDDEARGCVIAETRSASPRVRKACAIALGKLDGDDARAALLARWDAGDAQPDERRALAEALGKVGGDDALARLTALESGQDAELARRRDRALLMAGRAATREDDSAIVLDVPPPEPVAMTLGCRIGLASLLVEELTALGMAPTRRADVVDLTLAAPLHTLFASRLWATAAVRMSLEGAPRANARRGRPGDGQRVADPDALAQAITRRITAPATRALLRTWTHGSIRWRLGFAKGHKRAIVWRVARDVTAAAPELVNDPAATTWDLLVDDEAWTLELVPRRLADPRFAWRVAEVPAASHPTVAAALAWVAEVRPDDRVWDPFCGAGAELIERARRGPYRSLLGTDVDPAALEAARANASAAGLAIELALADARSHTPGPVELVITNPPLGSRVQLDAAALLVAALPQLASQLAPGGRLVWITPAHRKTTPVAEQLGLRRTRALPVDLGGVRGQLERWDRAR